MADPTCCVLHCATSATGGAEVSNGQITGLPIKLFLKPDHSGKMCAAHVEANREQAGRPAGPISLASTLGAKPAAGKIPMLMRARAAGQLPRQGSLDLPPKEAVAAVTRSESSPEVNASGPGAVGRASGLSGSSGASGQASDSSVPPSSAVATAPVATASIAQHSPSPSPRKLVPTPAPASPRSTPGPRPKMPQPMNPLSSSGKNFAMAAGVQPIGAVTPSGGSPQPTPANPANSASLSSVPITDSQAAPTAASASPLTMSAKAPAVKPVVSARSKAVEEAAATAELHSLATDKNRVRPFLDRLDADQAFREKMIADLKKGAELKRVGEKGALAKLQLRVSDDGDFLVVNGKTHFPLAELDEVRLGQLNDNFAKNAAKLRTFASNSFSYVWLRNDSIDVIAGSDIEFQLWSVGLRRVFDRKRDRLLSALAEPWMECIGSREEKASTKDMATILAKFNCNSSAIALREKLGLDENVKLSFTEFVYHFRRVLRARPEIEQLFMKYSSNKILLRPDELLSFLRQDQQDTSATLETACALIRKYRLLNSDGDRIEAGRRGAVKDKQEAESKERQARIDAKMGDRKKGFEQRRLEKQSSQQDAPPILGLSPEQEMMPSEEKVKILDGQLKLLIAAISSKENTREGLERLVSFYASDPAAQEQARKEAEQLLADVGKMKDQRVHLERKINNLRGPADKVGEDDDKASQRQAVARQAKELDDSIAAKQRSLAGLERLIAGYASDPAAQSRVRKEVADGRAEIARLVDAKQKLEKTAVELLASGSSAIAASDTAGRKAEVEAKYKEVRAELKSKLTSRRALVKMVQVYAADPTAQGKANRQLSDETAKLADLVELMRLLERQLVDLGSALPPEDPEMESELERLLGSNGAPRAGEKNLSASQVNSLLANATAAASASGKEKDLGMTLADFIDLMEGDENSALAPQHAKLHQDMTRPLCEYWIASSHNTYLTGDQFQSDSSVEMYVKVLKSGCRCIEIDIWDGPDGEPIVYHGHTLTSKISFRDVCRAVGEYAFVATPYPLILSFENHCSLKQQQRMAEIIRACFKNYLAVAVADTMVLPSPEELKEKILIKGKTNSGGAEQEDEGDQINAEEQADRKASVSATAGATGSSPTLVAPISQGSTESIVTSTPVDRARATPPLTGSGKKVAARPPVLTRPPVGRDSKKSDAQRDKDLDGTGEENKVSTTPDTMHPALSDITYLRARRFISFEAAHTGPPKCECSSFGEQRFLRLLQTSAAPFADLNKRALSRTYPKGTRVDSSNYSPTPCWNAGIQLVAINYQTPGRPMWLNQGRFAVNGGSGYVLKPDLLRAGSFDPNSTSQRIGKYAQLEVLLLSALQLPVGCSDPLAILSVTGLEADNKEYKSKVVKGNGFNPSWNERFFFTLQGSELAIFMICIETEAMTGDQRVAQVAFPVEALRPGYRVFPLYDREGRLIPQASILCKIALRRPDELKTL